MRRQELGALGEKLARDYLKKKGYHIRESNFRCREGEIDIVARKGGDLVFVEVRTRSSQTFGTPEESVTEAKKRKLVASALTYLSTHAGLPDSWRIDFLAIETDPQGGVKRISLIENALCD